MKTQDNIDNYDPNSGFQNAVPENYITVDYEEPNYDLAGDHDIQAPARDLNYGLFNLRDVDDLMKRCVKMPEPRCLYRDVWYEGELACLFADSNTGKSILAVQIARDIITRYGKRVFYFDFELTDKQFQMRYTSAEGYICRWNPLFKRVVVDPAKTAQVTTERIIDSLDHIMEKTGCNTIIIDNLASMSPTLMNGVAASNLMEQLMRIKFKHNASILVIAHTPKRNTARPITPNDLCGSKCIFDRFDSVFALGMSATEAGLRYLKQLKSRHGSIKYDIAHVKTLRLERSDDSFLHFVQQGEAHERQHLSQPVSTELTASAKAQIIELRKKGYSLMRIVYTVNVKYHLVQKICNELREQRLRELQEEEAAYTAPVETQSPDPFPEGCIDMPHLRAMKESTPEPVKPQEPQTVAEPQPEQAIQTKVLPETSKPRTFSPEQRAEFERKRKEREALAQEILDRRKAIAQGKLAGYMGKTIPVSDTVINNLL